MVIGHVTGLKISQNVNYIQRETMYGGAKRRSAEGVRSGLGRGALAPPQYEGLGALPPENFEI